MTRIESERQSSATPSKLPAGDAPRPSRKFAQLLESGDSEAGSEFGPDSDIPIRSRSLAGGAGLADENQRTLGLPGWMPSLSSASAAGTRDVPNLMDGSGPRAEASNLTNANEEPGMDSELEDDEEAGAAQRVSERPTERREVPSTAPKPVPKADLQNLIHKLVDSFRVGQNRAGATEVRMDLRHTVFDGMQIQLAQGAKGLEAILSVERYAAKSALEGQMAELTRRLERQGVEVSELKVEIRDQPAPGEHDSPNSDSTGSDGMPGESPSECEDPAPVHPESHSRPSHSIQSRTDYSL